MKIWLRENVLRGFSTSPLVAWRWSLLLLLIYAPLALWLGFLGGFAEPHVLEGWPLLVLPVTLFVFPSLLEEVVFRGLLIPRDSLDRGWKSTWGWILGSTMLFVAWHPLNALTINPGAREIFLNPYFLVTVFILGVVCGLGYVLSRSLWVPILIHWGTVLVWVCALGGRNLVL